jgi:hypothetical protein
MIGSGTVKENYLGMLYRIRNRGRYRTFVPIPTYRGNWYSIWNKVSDPNSYK